MKYLKSIRQNMPYVPLEEIGIVHPKLRSFLVAALVENYYGQPINISYLFPEERKSLYLYDTEVWFDCYLYPIGYIIENIENA